MMSKLSVIWDMQEFLNNETLKSNGYMIEIGETKKPLEINDFRTLISKLGNKACGKAGMIHYWTQQYTLAALMEVQEFEAELVSDDAVKRQLELIDILHFILSMYQVTGISKEEFEKRAAETTAGIFESEASDFGPDSKAYASKMRDSMFGVIKALPWKHWSKKVEFSVDEVRNLIDFTLLVWCRAAHSEHLHPERIHYLYTEKNKVNLARQASGAYSEANKKPDEGHIK